VVLKDGKIAAEGLAAVLTEAVILQVYGVEASSGAVIYDPPESGTIKAYPEASFGVGLWWPASQNAKPTGFMKTLELRRPTPLSVSILPPY
jgi:hypothetical protein